MEFPFSCFSIGWPRFDPELLVGGVRYISCRLTIEHERVGKPRLILKLGL